MDDIGDFIVGIVLTLLMILGTVFVFADFRHYTVIYQQCEKQGFIQNKYTRINCSVEKYENSN